MIGNFLKFLSRGIRTNFVASPPPKLGTSPLPSVFMSENPVYAKYDIGYRTYGRPVVREFDEMDSNFIVGKYSSIADGVIILLGGEHRTGTVSTYPFKQLLPGASIANNTSYSRGNIQVGNDVWIGLGSMILSGRKIGDGAVVAAGSVVTRDVPPYAIVAGNPAKVIRFRFSPAEIASLLKIAWWDWPEEKIVKWSPLLSNDNVVEFIQHNTPPDLSK